MVNWNDKHHHNHRVIHEWFMQNQKTKTLNSMFEFGLG